MEELVNKKYFAKDFEFVKLPPMSEDEFLGRVEWSLLLLDLTTFSAKHSKTDDHYVSMRTFDGVVLEDVAITDRELISLGPHPEVNLGLFNGNLNTKVLQLASRLEDEHKGEELVQMHHFRTLGTAETRNLIVPKSAKKILSVKSAMLTRTEGQEEWMTLNQNFAVENIHSSNAAKLMIKHLREKGEHLKNVSLDSKVIEEEGVIYSLSEFLQANFYGSDVLLPVPTKKGFYYSEDSLKRQIISSWYWANATAFKNAISEQLTQYYEWMIYLKEKPDSIGFRMFIDPAVSKDVFALRDAPLGKDGRKKALLNFVGEHYRKRYNAMSEEQTEILVRKHLRGETNFNWNGLECCLIPAQYDLNRIKTRKKFISFA